MTTGWSLREDSITLSPQEYTHASGIYKKMYFFLQMTMLHSCENRGHGTLFIYTQRIPACNALLLHRLLCGICLFTTSYLYWWWSFSLNLESDVAVEVNQAETVTYGPSGKWCSMKEEYRNIGKSNLNNSLFNWRNMLDMQKSLL